MLRRIFKDTATYTVGTILSAAAGVALLPLYTRRLPPSVFGVADLVAIVTNVVCITAGLEVHQGIARYYADAKSDDEKRLIASSGLGFSTVAYACVALGILAFGAPARHWLVGRDGPGPELLLAVTSVFASCVATSLASFLRWDLQPRASAVTSLATTVGAQVATIAFVLVGGLGLTGVLAGQAVGFVLACIVGGYCARDRLGIVFSLAQLRRMLSFSVPLVPASLSVIASLYMDRVVIKQTLPLDELGKFAIALRFGGVVGIGMSGLQAALPPLVLTRSEDPETPPLIARVFRYFALVAMNVLVAFVLFSEDLIRILTTRAYAESAPVIPLVAASVIVGGAYIWAPGFWIARRTGTMSALHISTTVLNTVLLIPFVRHWGILGAAWATATSASASFVLQLVLSQRLYPVPHRWPPVLAATAVSVAVAAAAQGLLRSLALSNDWASMGIKAAFAIVGLATTAAIVLDEQDRTIVREYVERMRNGGSTKPPSGTTG